MDLNKIFANPSQKPKPPESDYDKWANSRKRAEPKTDTYVPMKDGLLPKGKGTYFVLFVWICAMGANAAGLTVPGFEGMQGIEGAGIVGALIAAYFRRGMKK